MPCPVFCLVGITHLLQICHQFSLALNTLFLFPALEHSAVVTIKDIDTLVWYNFRVRDYDCCVAEKERMRQSNDNHKVLRCGRLGYE